MLPDLRGDRVGRRRLREEVRNLPSGPQDRHDGVVDEVVVIIFVVDRADRTVDAVRLPARRMRVVMCTT